MLIYCYVLYYNRLTVQNKMITTTLTWVDIIFFAAIGYLLGWIFIRLVGGGYVTQREFDSFVNQYRVDYTTFADKLVRIQQRYYQEDMQDEKYHSSIIDDILDTIISGVLRALTSKKPTLSLQNKGKNKEKSNV